VEFNEQLSAKRTQSSQTGVLALGMKNKIVMLGNMIIS
jgi:hypothetical protein